MLQLTFIIINDNDIVTTLDLRKYKKENYNYKIDKKCIIIDKILCINIQKTY